MLVAAAVTLAACGDGSTAPHATDPIVNPPPGQQVPDTTRLVAGRWGSWRIDEKALPAVIAGGTEPDGLTWEIRAVSDSLVIHADGRWEQRSRVRQVQSDGAQFGGTHYDRGRWTRSGDALHFESEWIQHVRFDGRLTSAGELVVEHDFTLDESIPPMRREMRK